MNRLKDEGQPDAVRTGLGGWLGLFSITLEIGSLINFFRGLNTLPWGLINVVAGLWGLGVCVLLFKKTPSAPRHAMRFLAALMVLTGISFVVALSLHEHAMSESELGALVIAAIWYGYFKRSKRVRATFNARVTVE